MKSMIKLLIALSLTALITVGLGGAVWAHASMGDVSVDSQLEVVKRLSPNLDLWHVAADSINRYPAVLRSMTQVQISSGDRFVVGGSFTLKTGEIQDGSIFILGGSVALEDGSMVDGDVILVGGSLQAYGTIAGDIFLLGGSLIMNTSTLVEGDVIGLGGSIQGEELATIGGEINTDVNSLLPIIVPRGSIPLVAPGGIRIPNIEVGVNPFWSFLWFLLRTLLWTALAVIVVLFLPKPVDRVAHTVVSQPLISGGLGLLTVIVAPVLMIAIGITIIGIPISLIAALALVITWVYGMVAIGAEVGKRLARAFNADWALPVCAGLGTFLLILLVDGARELIPCAGWVIGFLVGIVGLGAVLLTRYGSQVYPTESLEPAPAPVEEKPVSPTEPAIAPDEWQVQEETPPQSES